MRFKKIKVLIISDQHVSYWKKQKQKIKQQNTNKFQNKSDMN